MLYKAVGVISLTLREMKSNFPWRISESYVVSETNQPEDEDKNDEKYGVDHSHESLAVLADKVRFLHMRDEVAPQTRDMIAFVALVGLDATVY